MLTDPISDMLTRVRNAGQAGHVDAEVPASKLKLAVASVMKEEGYIANVLQETKEGHPILRIVLRYDEMGKPLIDGLKRISRPGRRVYVPSDEIPKVRNGLGIAVISTSKGVMTDCAAREANVGGEILCEVW